METIEKISSLLKKTFDKTPWYGPSVMDALNGVDEKISHRRIGESHSIVELVNHMTAWRRFVTERLKGNGDYKVEDDENFPVDTNWKKAVNDLRESQQQLLAALSKFPEDKLSELVPHPSYKYTFYTMIHGVIQHDVYHIGQIVIIKKAIE